MTEDELINLKIAKIREPMPTTFPDWNLVYARMVGGGELFTSPQQAWLCVCRYEQNDDSTWIPAPVAYNLHHALKLLSLMREKAEVNLILNANSISVSWQGKSVALPIGNNSEARSIALCFLASNQPT